MQGKGLDPNFAVMLKERGLDPTILAPLERSSLNATRDHKDNTDVDSNTMENDVLKQLSWSERAKATKN